MDNAIEVPGDSGRDTVSEADGSEASGAETSHGFFDIEASESDNSYAEPSESEPGILYSFPQFTRIPIELRWRIWEFFCPDLAAKPRVLGFHVVPSRGDRPDDVSPDPPAYLQATAVRTVLATHRESRALALQAFPDSLSIASGRGGFSLQQCERCDSSYRPNNLQRSALPSPA